MHRRFNSCKRNGINRGYGGSEKSWMVKKTTWVERWSKRKFILHRLHCCSSYFYWRIRERDVVDSPAEEQVLECVCAMQPCLERMSKKRE